ncbi:MAG: isoquinoline 1-oxidoreductase beta subunit [Cyclobacteriaceae bacterium]|jgi:isoquinoline 1-oxidoreductase beta subunit
MTVIKTSHNRRSFLKVSAASAGGLMIGFNWACSPRTQDSVLKPLPSEWFNINAYLSIGDNGVVTIMSPNPEIGQNVKTSMPMIVAEELDVDWADVRVKQAPLNTDVFTRQVAGGSQSIRQGWESLRMAGGTARQLLVNTAAEKWKISPDQISTQNGQLIHPDGSILSYGAIAAEAAGQELPTEVTLKDPKDFKIIGTDRLNVDAEDIVSGKPLFGIDTRREGMVFATMMRPPAFGMSLESFNAEAALKVPGVEDVIQIGDKIAIIANGTWPAMKAQKMIQAKWTASETLEDTSGHDNDMLRLLTKKSDEPKRTDGNVEKSFLEADQIIEKTYEAPFLPHNTMEPMNFFAEVTDTKIELLGPIQTPEWTRRRVAELLQRDESEVSMDMTRMGGGFGRRLYGDFVLEAAQISDKIRKPVQLVFSREDDMTAGTYRPASKYRFKAALKDGEMTGYQLTGTGVNMGNATRQNNWPAAAMENYLVDSHELKSNITTGAWRAPITNFLAYAEQAFIDEVAEAAGRDPLAFRISLFERAKNNPVGELAYDPEKSIGVIKLVAEKAGWGKQTDGVYQGFSTYYSHNTYVAEIADVVMSKGQPKVTKVTVAIDCGIVVNPIAAINQAQGGVIDGVGHALYGDFSFESGKPSAANFDTYRLIRMKESPQVDIHFVESNNSPTGLGEPTLPPAGGAIANAIYAATGKRLYKQPFTKQDIVSS